MKLRSLLEDIQNFDRAFDAFIKYTNKVFDKAYKGTGKYATLTKPEIEFSTRQSRFIKVWKDDGHKSVLFFVERDTGHIYKPATWKAPAKGPRASIYDKKSYANMDVYGSWLYKRG